MMTLDPIATAAYLSKPRDASIDPLTGRPIDPASQIVAWNPAKIPPADQLRGAPRRRMG